MLNISFIIPTYNASFHIKTCLESIVKQNYPKDKVEIIILDGGSIDNTLDIVQNYDCVVLENEKKLAEYGVQIGMQKASGELLVVFAADNELVNSNWIQMVADVFENDRNISAVWGKLVSGNYDSSLNKYFELIQSDPLNWFLNQNIHKYKAKGSMYKDNCFTFEVNPEVPLVWGANGLVYRADRIRKIWKQSGYLGDNDAFQHMIEAGHNKVGYFDCSFVYHHHISKLSDWIKKWQRNFTSHLADKHKTRNMNWAFAKDYKIKLLLWIFYNLIPVFSLSQSVYLVFKDKNIYWLYHPLVSFAQFLTYAYLTVFTPKGRRFVANCVLRTGF